MQVLCDKRGFVQSFAFVGNLVDGIETPEPAEMSATSPKMKYNGIMRLFATTLKNLLFSTGNSTHLSTIP